MKYTQGPWQIENDSIIGNIDGGYGEDGSQVRFDVICSMWDGYFETLDNWKDNARLIAAAPELLEALEKVSTYQKEAMDGSLEKAKEMFYELVKEIEPLIAKAKGNEG